VSNTDSFIEEVNEEVRRDQMNRMLARYGWIAALVVIVAVGGAAANEFFKSRTETAARDLGQAIDTAYRNTDPEERAAALSGLGETDTPLVGFLEAGALLEAGDFSAAVSRFESIAESHANDAILRDLALIRMVGAQAQAGVAASERQQTLDPIINNNDAFALLALELRAVGFIEMGRTEDALSDLERIYTDPQVTAALRDRVSTLIVVLGGELPETTTLLDG
jgi:hypothetical protein